MPYIVDEWMWDTMDKAAAEHRRQLDKDLEQEFPGVINNLSSLEANEHQALRRRLHLDIGDLLDMKSLDRIESIEQETDDLIVAKPLFKTVPHSPDVLQAFVVLANRLGKVAKIRDIKFTQQIARDSKIVVAKNHEELPKDSFSRARIVTEDGTQLHCAAISNNPDQEMPIPFQSAYDSNWPMYAIRAKYYIGKTQDGAASTYVLLNSEEFSAEFLMKALLNLVEMYSIQSQPDLPQEIAGNYGSVLAKMTNLDISKLEKNGPYRISINEPQLTPMFGRYFVVTKYTIASPEGEELFSGDITTAFVELPEQFRKTVEFDDGGSVKKPEASSETKTANSDDTTEV